MASPTTPGPASSTSPPTTRGSVTSPSTSRSAWTGARSTAPWASWPRSSTPPRPGESSYIDLAQSDAAAAMDWYRSESFRAYERPESEVTGNKADNYERRAAGHGRHGRGRALPGLRGGRRRYVLFMASEQAFWKNFCEGVDRIDLFERWPGSKYADHARGNRELQRELHDIFRTKTAQEWLRVRGTGQHANRAGQHAEDAARGPAVRRPLPAAPGLGDGGGPTLHPAALRR